MKIDSLFKFEFDYYHMQNAIECLKGHNMWLSLKLFIEIEHNPMTRHSDWNHPFILHSSGSDRYRYEVKYCRRIQFGCVFYWRNTASVESSSSPNVKYICTLVGTFRNALTQIYACCWTIIFRQISYTTNIIRILEFFLKKLIIFFFFITSSIEELHLLKQKKKHISWHIYM